MMRFFYESIFALTLIAISGCAAPKPFVPDNPYPSRGEVEALEALPVPEVKVTPGGMSVERWPLAGPFPDMIGAQPRRPITPLEKIASAYTGGATVTEQMTCAARELGRFVIENGEYPSTQLELFILNRCGSLAQKQHVQMKWYTWAAPDDGIARSEQILTRDAFDELAKMSSSLGERHRHAELGAWFGAHEDGRAFAFFATGRLQIELEPTSRVPRADAKLVLEGRSLEPAYRVFARINRGKHESSRCVSDARVKAPRFKIECQTQPNDASAIFTINVTPRRTSPLASERLVQRAWPSGEPANEYVSSQHDRLASKMRVDGQVGSEVFPEEFVGMVNKLRAEHGLPPLLHSEAQTKTVQRLTPAFMAAAEDSERERILLAMRAGWGIANASIVESSFSTRSTPTKSPQELLSMLADNPHGRNMLFMKGTGALAIGAIPQGDTSFVMVCSYTFLPELTHRQRIKVVQDTVNDARALAGHGKMRRYKDFYDYTDDLAEEIAQGRLDPLQARKDLVDEVISTLNQGVYHHGWFVHDLEDFGVPEDLVVSPTLNGAILVAEFQPEGMPHVGYYIVIVCPGSLSEGYKKWEKEKK